MRQNAGQSMLVKSGLGVAAAAVPSLLVSQHGMSSRLYVGGLGQNVDESRLQQAFGAYGRIVEVKIPVDDDDGNSRGFGFVTFSSPQQGELAIAGMNEQELDRRRIHVTFSLHG